ncbi:MAG: hypothetical protein K0Q68_72 [Moraxellaceae bacterium]|nr:hypothetical protein [Moraxellaceae bacterium]
MTKTRTVFTLGGFATALLLAACGGGSGSTESPNTITPGPVATASEGSWTGSIDTPQPESRGLRAVILPDGRFWMTYTGADSGSVAGIVQGQGALSGTTFTATDATLLSLEDDLSTRVDLAAGAVAQSSLTGTLTLAGDAPAVNLPSPAQFSALYQLSSGQTLTLADLAGVYSGDITTATGVDTATVTIAPDGTLSGSNSAGCSLAGNTVAPAGGNVFTVSLHFGDEAACGANQAIAAEGVLTLSTAQVTVLALDSSKTNSFIFNGSK